MLSGEVIREKICHVWWRNQLLFQPNYQASEVWVNQIIFLFCVSTGSISGTEPHRATLYKKEEEDGVKSLFALVKNAYLSVKQIVTGFHTDQSGFCHLLSHFSRISSWLIEKWNRNLKIKPNKQSNPKEQSEKESIPAGFKGMKKVRICPLNLLLINFLDINQVILILV